MFRSLGDSAPGTVLTHRGRPMIVLGRHDDQTEVLLHGDLVLLPTHTRAVETPVAADRETALARAVAHLGEHLRDLRGQRDLPVKLEPQQQLPQQALMQAVKKELVPGRRMFKTAQTGGKGQIRPGGRFAAVGAMAFFAPGQGQGAFRAEKRFLLIPKRIHGRAGRAAALGREQIPQAPDPAPHVASE